MSNLVERLRRLADSDEATISVPICGEAADEIERLQTELRAYKQDYGAIIGSQKGRIDQLTRALENFADETHWSDRVGCLQWMGKRHAIEFAQSALTAA